MKPESIGKFLIESQWFIVLLAIAASAWMGLSLSTTPYLVSMVAATSAFLVLTTLGRSLEVVFLWFLSALIVGYMLQGRGFAYLGLPPIYVGEIALLFGVATVILARIKMRFTTLELLLVAFMLLGFARTLPYVRDGGTVVVRDAALWYYAIFALLLSWFLTEQGLMALVRGFARMLPVFIGWLTLMSSTFQFFQDRLPHFPGSPLPIISLMKPGDRAVVLVALAAFLLTGLYHRAISQGRIPSALFWTCWLICVAFVAAVNRGGMLAIVVALGFVALIQPTKELTRVLLIGSFLLMLVLVVNPTIDVGGEREVSVEQFRTNITSILSDETNEGSVQGTKNWRLKFWTAVYDDTVQGPGFWLGTGFGLNLATHYGYQATLDESLRSPHNSLVTVLARMGVPGAMLWLSIQFGFLVKMIYALRVARQSFRPDMAKIFIWVLAIWLAAIVNSMFDVYLEGPQGAIPFWCVFGVGLAALRIQSDALRAEHPATLSLTRNTSAHPANS